ncbi:hypothetical protein [uncultured Bartonella sp.]|uniref:hypothetical protein n=1 Tax=uncultured Bartonella sp. TaxID=104108 RepID=UPI0025ECB45B|nr:hypothetical protein [uncultured Bartonella sp.]
MSIRLGWKGELLICFLVWRKEGGRGAIDRSAKSVVSKPEFAEPVSAKTLCEVDVLKAGIGENARP